MSPAEQLAALNEALDVLRAALVEEVAKAERAAASEVDRSAEEALDLGAADAYGEAIQRLDVVRPARRRLRPKPPRSELVAVGVCRWQRQPRSTST